MKSKSGSITIIDIPLVIVRDILDSKDIAVFFDKNLVYVIVNDAACRQLNKKPEELLGKSITELYPSIVASHNHRNLLRALSGETIRNSFLESKTGTFFYCFYQPVYQNNELIGVVSKATLTKRRM